VLASGEDGLVAALNKAAASAPAFEAYHHVLDGEPAFTAAATAVHVYSRELP